MSRKIIAILRGIRFKEAVAITHELIEAGISIIEVPLNSPEPLKSIEVMSREFSQDALIGAGTVLNPKDVKAIADAGGRIIVSPDCNPDVITTTKAADLLSYPGVFSPSDYFSALRNGADGLKIFPANLTGPEGLRAIKPTLPEGTQMYAVGGVGVDNFKQWFAAGISGFGIGSALYKPGFTPSDVRRRAKEIVTEYDNSFSAS